MREAAKEMHFREGRFLGAVGSWLISGATREGMSRIADAYGKLDALAPMARSGDRGGWSGAVAHLFRPPEQPRNDAATRRVMDALSESMMAMPEAYSLAFR